MDRLPDEPPVFWPPKRKPEPPRWPTPPLIRELTNGALGRCPACGKTRLFSGYMRVVPKCTNCGAPLGDVPVESAPAYLTIVLVAVFVIGAIVILDSTITPPAWLEAVILLPLTFVLTVLLLRPTKGATIGLLLWLGITEPP